MMQPKKFSIKHLKWSHAKLCHTTWMPQGSGASWLVFIHQIKRIFVLKCNFITLHVLNNNFLKVMPVALWIYHLLMVCLLSKIVFLHSVKKRLKRRSIAYTLWRLEIQLQGNQSLELILKFQWRLMLSETSLF